MTEVRRVVATGGSRPLEAFERGGLRDLLDEIPVGADQRYERVTNFVREWYRLHVAAAAGNYAVHYLRAQAATVDVLERLRSSLDDPDLGPSARNNCDCRLCRELRGGRLRR